MVGEIINIMLKCYRNYNKLFIIIFIIFILMLQKLEAVNKEE